ncbi:MAG TPA: hypothetical protein PKV71_16185 [Calditrichia bacterium]|nr:hypothetical protein [Calditrichota bacterium]HQU71778.1 hypothetical protein [Calditrichia bacterium]HQV33426.1 hypothetical protein [Calditrichia bacterium]
MAISILGPLNKIINQAASEILDSQITDKMSDVLNTAVNTGFKVVVDALGEIKELTKDEEPAPEARAKSKSK